MEDLQDKFSELLEKITIPIWPPLNENINELKFFHLRTLFSAMAKRASGETKKILVELLKVITIMEIRKAPVPTVKKQSAHSSSVWEK